jgi:hypothetical protein
MAVVGNSVGWSGSLEHIAHPQIHIDEFLKRLVDWHRLGYDSAPSFDGGQ